MSINLLALISATLTIATPLVWASIGEVIIERTGVLDLGIEGTMYVGAFVGFLLPPLSAISWKWHGSKLKTRSETRTGNSKSYCRLMPILSRRLALA